MKDAIREPGFYFFPGQDMSKSMSESEEAAYAAKVEARPDGSAGRPSRGERKHVAPAVVDGTGK